MKQQRQWRLRWQRLGMSRPRQKTWMTEATARRFALIVQGRIAEAFPDKDPEAYFCCPGTMSYECGCGGRTNAEEWTAWSARQPPLIWGPVLDSRPVGEWEDPEVLNEPETVPESVVEAFKRGGGFWPIRTVELVSASPAGVIPGDGDDIPF